VDDMGSRKAARDLCSVDADSTEADFGRNVLEDAQARKGTRKIPTNGDTETRRKNEVLYLEGGRAKVGGY